MIMQSIIITAVGFVKFTTLGYGYVIPQRVVN